MMLFHRHYHQLGADLHTVIEILDVFVVFDFSA
jgi:hypothetical protein